MEALLEYFTKNPNMVIPIISAIAVICGSCIALVSSFLTSRLSGANNIKVEREKLNSSLIIKAIDTDDYRRSLDNLQFFLSIGLIKDKKGWCEKKGNIQKVIDGDIDIPIPALKRLKYDIIASNRNSVFSLQTSINARIEISHNEIEITLNSLELELKESYPYEKAYIPFIVAGLTKYTNRSKGIWNTEKKSNTVKIDLEVTKEKSTQLKDLVFKIDRRTYDNLNDYWITFEISQKENKDDESYGTSYLHYKDLNKVI